MSRDKQNIKTTDWLTRGIPEEQLKREKQEAIREAEAELRNKQIEEMAYEMTQYKEPVCKRIEDNKCLLRFHAHAFVDCHFCKLAEHLITEKGYRKVVEQSETARECEKTVDKRFPSSVTESVTRAEVAEEIFADCHNTLIKILNTVRDGLDKAIREGNEEAKLVHIGTEETVKCIILIFAELKKKYTKNKGE